MQEFTLIRFAGHHYPITRVALKERVKRHHSNATLLFLLAMA
jgi:hypothetical protein